MIEIKKIVKKWEILNKKEKVAKLEEEVKRTVLKYFHKWIYIFCKKASKKMFTIKI